MCQLEDRLIYSIKHKKVRQIIVLYVNVSQALLAHTSKSEWVGDSSCTHRMAKLASFPHGVRLSKKNVANNYALTSVGYDKIEC